MKKTTFLSLVIAVIISTVIAFQAYKEATANQDVSVTVTIYEVSRDYHGPYTAQLINLTTREITPLSMNLEKFNVPPSIRGGTRPVPNASDNFVVHVCSTNGPLGTKYGAVSPPFHITQSHTDISVTTGLGCPQIPSTNE